MSTISKAATGFFHSSTDVKKLSPKLQTILAQIPATSAALRNVVDRAEAMPTTLWFNDKSELPAIVVAGQATMCFNLMKHIVRNYKFDDQTETFPEDVQVCGRN